MGIPTSLSLSLLELKKKKENWWCTCDLCTSVNKTRDEFTNRQYSCNKVAGSSVTV